MDKDDLRKYNNKQRQEIEKFKWIESEKEGHDIGNNAAALKWISKYAEHYRNVWFCDEKCQNHQTELCQLNNILKELESKPPEEVFKVDKLVRNNCDCLKHIKENFSKGN